MSKNMHIPGPWKVEVTSDEDSDNYVYTVKEAQSGDILGICDLNRYNKSHETLVATAELIASAPQLREQNRVLRLEFQSLLNVIDDSYDEDLPVEIVEARNKAQAALTATSQPGGTHEL